MSAYKYVAPSKPAASEKKQPVEAPPAIRIGKPLTATEGIIVQRLDLSNLFPGKRDAFAVVLDNVFTPEECKLLIDKSEAAGYDEALVGGQQERVETQRNNWRCIIDDTDMAEMVYQRLYNYLPVEWLGTKVIGLNERMRFLKYHPGEYFKPHNDGIYVRADNSQCSYVTIHLYLNDVEADGGGETTFTTQEMTYGRHVKKQGREGGEESIKRMSVQPVCGRVLVFEHHLPHEGSTLLKGVKYTVRTDVMYDLVGESKRKKGERGPKEEREERGSKSSGDRDRERETNGGEYKPVHRGPRWSVRYPHPQYKLGKELAK